jgi:hypothetical protein
MRQFQKRVYDYYSMVPKLNMRELQDLNSSESIELKSLATEADSVA